MGASGSKGHNMVPARFALKERVYTKGAAPAKVGRREMAARGKALRLGKEYNALASNNAYGVADRANIARGLKARAAAELWAARKQRLSNAATRVAGAARNGALAAAGAVASGVGALGAGAGAAGSFLVKGAKAAYNAAAAKTRNAYNGLRALSLKRRAKNLFLGKVKLTSVNRGLAQARGLNPNSTEFRKILANRGAAGRPGSVAGNKPARSFEREGGVARKIASLTRQAKAGLMAAAAAAGRGAVAARNAVTKKASNLYAYGRNMLKYGRRRSDVERLDSAKRRAKGAQNDAFDAIDPARNANAAAVAGAAARDETLRQVKAGLVSAANKMGEATVAAGRGAAAAAGAAAGAALALVRGITQKAGKLAGNAGSALTSGLTALGRAAGTLKGKLSNSPSHRTGKNAQNSLFGKKSNNTQNGAPNPAALRASTVKLRSAASAVGDAQKAPPGKIGSALASAGRSVAAAVVAAGSAIGSRASAAVSSARSAGSTLARALEIRMQAVRNAGTEYSASVQRQQRANARTAKAARTPALAPVISPILEGNENNNNNNNNG